jgi:hypothetical protein
VYLYNKQVLVGWWSFAVKEFCALQYNNYEFVCCYNHSHRNAVKGFWALWKNIYVMATCVTTLDFSPFLAGNFLVLCIILTQTHIANSHMRHNSVSKSRYLCRAEVMTT